MARNYTLNQLPNSGGNFTWRYTNALLGAGYTKIADSDGTTYSAAGTQVTTGGTGANGFDNNSAWQRIRFPTGTKEYCVQRGSASTNNTWWRVSLTGFTGGAPAATVAPTAADQQSMFGAAAAGAAQFSATLLNQQIFVDTTSPYASGAVGYAVGGGIVAAVNCMDPMQANTYNAGDTDPVMYLFGGQTTMFTSVTGGTGGFGAAAGAAANNRANGFVNGTWLSIPQLVVKEAGNGSFYPGQAGNSVYDGKGQPFPILYGRRSTVASPGPKGVSTVLGLYPVELAACGDTIGSKANLIIDYSTLWPWDGVTVPNI